MNAELRTCAAIALLAMCASAPGEPVKPASTSEKEPSDTRLVINVPKASAEDNAPAAGEHRAESGRRLTLQQKRIFVLGLAAQEKK